MLFCALCYWFHIFYVLYVFYVFHKSYIFYIFTEQDYNQVADDMRSDDETMSELHQKVDDLRERLWNICDERKASAETERQDIINDGWLDDRLGIVSNQYITQMQVDAKANIDS